MSGTSRSRAARPSSTLAAAVTTTPRDRSTSASSSLRVAVVVHDERPHARQGCRIGTPCGNHDLAAALDGGHPRRLNERQRDHERRALPLARARDVDSSAVQLDDVPDDRQPEAESLMRARRPAVALPEPIEHVRQHRRLDPLTGVGHFDLELRFVPRARSR